MFNILDFLKPFSREVRLEKYLRSSFLHVVRNDPDNLEWTVVLKDLGTKWYDIRVYLLNNSIKIWYLLPNRDTSGERSMTIHFKDLLKLSYLIRTAGLAMRNLDIEAQKETERDEKAMEVFLNSQIPKEDIEDILQEIKDLSVVKPVIAWGFHVIYDGEPFRTNLGRRTPIAVCTDYDVKKVPYYRIRFERPVILGKDQIKEFSEFMRLLDDAIKRIEMAYEVQVEWIHKELTLIVKVIHHANHPGDLNAQMV